jgi:hypothetical protein
MNDLRWKYGKTYAETPHEYVLRNQYPKPSRATRTRRRQTAMKYQHPELEIVRSALNDTNPRLPPVGA